MPGTGETAPQILTVSEITAIIAADLESDPELKNVWVKGEISTFTPARSGHWYFSLKDEKTVINCVMFSNWNANVDFEVKPGMKVLVRGSVSVYKPRGSYSIQIRELRPEGIGELWLKFLALREKLAKEGLFDDERKKPIPEVPVTVGVVTSPTGAAVKDIIRVLRRRAPYVNILLAPATVQGEGAAETIVHGIELLNKVGGVDVMIIGRGGGSMEDLWAFNEEIVARAIAAYKIPIISAVGHERDFTIADFVADLRAATPSAAAELAALPLDDLDQELEQLLTDAGAAIQHMLQDESQGLDELGADLQAALTQFLALERERLEAVGARLNAVSPLAVLQRGYSVAVKPPDKEAVTSIEQVTDGDDIDVIVTDGQIQCKVTGKEGKHG